MSSSASVEKDFFSTCANDVRRELLPDQRHDHALSVVTGQLFA
jgi:hypothetical protein